MRSFVGPQLFLRLNGLFKFTTLFRCFEAWKPPRMCTFRTFKNFAQKINYWKLKLLFLEAVYQRNVLGENKKKKTFLRVSTNSRSSQKIALKIRSLSYYGSWWDFFKHFSFSLSLFLARIALHAIYTQKANLLKKKKKIHYSCTHGLHENHMTWLGYTGTRRKRDAQKKRS